MSAMPVLGLNHINLRAPLELMDALRAFYVDVIGLEAGPRPPFGSVGHWLYAGGHPVVHLSLASPAEGRVPGARNAFDHAAFDCTDRAAVEARLAALGLHFDVARVPGTSQVQIFLSDPAGNGVELNFAAG
jgi:catechol 2,3-dioxygenase-like lactoylglutathione lyase family enzyme